MPRILPKPSAEVWEEKIGGRLAVAMTRFFYFDKAKVQNPR
jgi:hypothetical protein